MRMKTTRPERKLMWKFKKETVVACASGVRQDEKIGADSDYILELQTPRFMWEWECGGGEKGKVKGCWSIFSFWIKLREEPPLHFEHNILRCFRHQIETLNNQGNLQILKVLRDSSFLFMRFRYKLNENIWIISSKMKN